MLVNVDINPLFNKRSDGYIEVICVLAHMEITLMYEWSVFYTMLILFPPWRELQNM